MEDQANKVQCEEASRRINLHKKQKKSQAIIDLRSSNETDTKHHL